MWRELVRFGVVGGVGFVTDAAFLTWLLHNGLSVVVSRGTSFALAVSATYVMNRLWTFSSRRRHLSHREYLGYFAVQVTGAMINLGIFFTYLRLIPSHSKYPILPLAAGAVVALIFNFLASRAFVFSRLARD